MLQPGFTLVTDRGGHLHNARMLLDQMGVVPQTIVTTLGPDINTLKESSGYPGSKIICVPCNESRIGKQRIWNPLRFIVHLFVTFFYVLRLRPRVVVSLGAANVVPFCYWAKLFGAEIYHVECMNQVFSKSITGRLLYPICTGLYVQWKELLHRYGPKAIYAGWVL